MSQIPINLPARIMKGQTVTALHMNALREAIYRLASRKHDKGNGMPSEGFTHPWKVTANGDDTVKISAGNILSYANDESTADQSIPAYINLQKFGAYAGGDVTVSGTGVIYGQVAISEGDIASIDYPSSSEIGQIDLIRHVPSGTISVLFASSLPTTGDYFNFEIAEVSLVDGDAVVNLQTITHNPTIHSFKIASTGI